MTDTITLNQNYSTTRLLTKEKLVLEHTPEDTFETLLFLPENKERKGEGGLRTKGYFKKSYEDKPLITVITVVFNGEEYLEQTIHSVINQSYDNVEYIIIDGDSTDGTLDIVKKYESQIDYWVSENDKGIYDAMNKGIKVSTGKWINFMNAGDRFFNTETIFNICIHIDKRVDLLYGDTEMRYKTFVRERKADIPKTIKKRMPFGHQSMFVKTKVHKNNLYNIKYTICADYDFACAVYQKNIFFKKVDFVLSSCSTDGLSDIQNIRRTKQSAEIAYRYFPILSVKFYHQKNILKNYIKTFFKKVLPSQLVETIKRLK